MTRNEDLIRAAAKWASQRPTRRISEVVFRGMGKSQGLSPEEVEYTLNNSFDVFQLSIDFPQGKEWVTLGHADSIGFLQKFLADFNAKRPVQGHVLYLKLQREKNQCH